jgi:hypothetical protein
VLAAVYYRPTDTSHEEPVMLKRSSIVTDPLELQRYYDGLERLDSLSAAASPCKMSEIDASCAHRRAKHLVPGKQECVAER